MNIFLSEKVKSLTYLHNNVGFGVVYDMSGNWASNMSVRFFIKNYKGNAS